MTQRSEVVSAALSYLGVRWRHMGRNRKGVDCVGLLIAVGRDLGLIDPGWDTPPYRLQPDGTMLGYFHEHARARAKHQIKNGTMVVFSFFGSPYHAGIVTDAKRGAIVHAYAPSRKVIADMLEHGQNGRKFVGAWDYEGVTDG